MKRNRNLLIALMVFMGLSCLAFDSGKLIWKKSGTGIIESETTSLAISPIKNSLVFAGAGPVIYKSVDGGQNYQRIFQIPGNMKVNCLTIDKSGSVYAASDAGLYLSKNDSSSWQKIFTSSDAKERQCRWVLPEGEKIYLATMCGLMIRDAAGGLWKKGEGALGRASIFFIVQDSGFFYFALVNEILRADNSFKNIDKVFSLLAHEAGDSQPVSDESAGESSFDNQQIYFLTADKARNRLYAATSKGIFLSPDKGAHWQGLEKDSLPFDSVTSLVALDDGEVMLGTRQGIFHYRDQRWNQVYKGMETNKVNFLAQSVGGEIYVATDKGVFQLVNSEEARTSGVAHPDSRGDLAEHEPKIQDVQKMAIEYAEVNPEKIKSWRRAAKNKAWLPTLSAGLDRSATEMYHWDSGPNPDNLLKGRDFLDWDISLSWNLGELIWNNDQTSIDSRSKLMVELREDIVDQVTRLYFERRRLQRELLILENIPEVEKMDKASRIEELTALIDGFTGGEFSEKIKNEKM